MSRGIRTGCLLLLLLWSLGGGQAMAMGMGGFGSPDPTLAGPVIAPGPLTAPMRLTLAGGQRILATDYNAQVVVEVNPSRPDRPRRLFTVSGHPLGIAENGTAVFVGNDTTGTIDVFGRRGRKVASIAVAEPMQASDLEFDRRRRQLFVVDGRNPRVRIFSVNRLHAREIFSFGGFGQLVAPKGLALDSRAREVYVSDYGDPAVGVSASIQVFDFSGRHLRTLTGPFSRPQGLVLAGGRLFLADALRGQVLVLDPASGDLLGTLGSYGTAPGQLLLPMDVAYDRFSRRLFVTNNRNGRITPLTVATP